MQGHHNIEPGSSSSSPFAVDFNNLPIVAIVNKMWTHTPQEKLSLIKQWAVNSKMAVETDHCLLMVEILQCAFQTANPSRSQKETDRYKSIQKDGKHWLMQRLNAIASAEKMLNNTVGMQESWLMLMKANPDINAYKQWAYKNNNIAICNGEDIVDDVCTALTVSCKVSKK